MSLVNILIDFKFLKIKKIIFFNIKKKIEFFSQINIFIGEINNIIRLVMTHQSHHSYRDVCNIPMKNISNNFPHENNMQQSY